MISVRPFLVSTPNQQSPLPTVTKAASVSADTQPDLEATYAVTTGENAPARFPKVFIIPATDPEYRLPRSMHAAQNVTEANMLHPAAAAKKKMAVTLLGACAPDHISTADENIPSQTAIRCPQGLSKTRTAKSENRPPSGDATAIAIYGAAP